jgi:hypothetical protein
LFEYGIASALNILSYTYAETVGGTEGGAEAEVEVGAEAEAATSRHYFSIVNL